MSHHGLDLGPIARVELACRDLPRQRDFYARIMGLAGASEVLVSAATVGMADGSGLGFQAQGTGAVRSRTSAPV